MIYKRINFNIHKDKYEACIDKVVKNHGFMSLIKPQKAFKNPDFLEVEAYFENVKDMNAFLYQAHNGFGLYFSLNTAVNTTRKF